MVRWQPPPLGAQNGELTGYKIRYRKAGRKGDAAEIITNQLFQLIDGRFHKAPWHNKVIVCFSSIDSDVGVTKVQIHRLIFIQRQMIFTTNAQSDDLDLKSKEN